MLMLILILKLILMDAAAGNFPGTGPEPDLHNEKESVTNLLRKCAARSGLSDETDLAALKLLLYLSTKEGMAVAEAADSSASSAIPLPQSLLAILDHQHTIGPDDRSRRIVNRELVPGRASRRGFRKGWVDVTLEMVCVFVQYSILMIQWRGKRLLTSSRRAFR
jgi:hypothetical protein